MRAWHISIGFAVFTALAIVFALRSARTTPLWLVVGAVILGLLIAGKVTLTLLSLEKKHALAAQERQARGTRARAQGKGRARR